MWLPEDAPYRLNTEWLRDTYPSSNRYQTMMVIAKDGGNILSAENVKAVYAFREALAGIRTNDTAAYNGTTWSEICTRVPGRAAGKAAASSSPFNSFLLETSSK